MTDSSRCSEGGSTRAQWEDDPADHTMTRLACGHVDEPADAADDDSMSTAKPWPTTSLIRSAPDGPAELPRQHKTTGSVPSKKAPLR